MYCFESCLNIVHLTMSLKGRDSIRRLPGHCDRLAGRDLYRATPAVTRDLGFCGLVRRTAQTSSPFTTSKGYLGPIFTQILTVKTNTKNEGEDQEKKKERELQTRCFISCYLLIHCMSKEGLLELKTRLNLRPSQHLLGRYSIVPLSFPGSTLSFSL